MKIIFSKLLILLAIVIASSCSSNMNPGHMNQSFERKYGSQVDQILENKKIKKRDFMVDGTQNTKFRSSPEFKLYSSPSQILAVEPPSGKSSSFETHKLYLKTPQEHFPTSRTYEVGKKNSASSKIPDDIFDINYNTSQHTPFQITGIDFDIIVIPKKDAFGIASSLNEKSYPIVGNNYVSRNINSIINNRTEEDVEFTEKLIEEQKLIRKQIAVTELYESDGGNQTIDKNSYDYDNTNEDWAVQKRKIRNDPVNKIIASQIVTKNLKASQKAIKEAAEEKKKSPPVVTKTKLAK